REPARDGERHDRAVLGDVGRVDRDFPALDGLRSAHRLHGVREGLGRERLLVPLGAGDRRLEDARGRGERQDREAAGILQDFPATAMHSLPPRRPVRSVAAGSATGSFTWITTESPVNYTGSGADLGSAFEIGRSLDRLGRALLPALRGLVVARSRLDPARSLRRLLALPERRARLEV